MKSNDPAIFFIMGIRAMFLTLNALCILYRVHFISSFIIPPNHILSELYRRTYTRCSKDYKAPTITCVSSCSRTISRAYFVHICKSSLAIDNLRGYSVRAGVKELHKSLLLNHKLGNFHPLRSYVLSCRVITYYWVNWKKFTNHCQTRFHF
jgi:hypothetical protein